MIDNYCKHCNKQYLCTEEEVKKCTQRKFKRDQKIKLIMEME